MHINLGSGIPNLNNLRLLEQPAVAKQISFRFAKSKKSVTFSMAVCLKIRKKN